MHLLNRVSPVQRGQLGSALLWMLASSLLMLATPLLLGTFGLPLVVLLGSQTVVGIGLPGWLGLERLRARSAASLPDWLDVVRALALGIGVGAAGSASLGLIWHASGSARAALEARAELLAPVLGAGPLVALVVLAALPASCEEIFYRGLLRRTLAAWSAGARVAVIAALFAAAHLDPISAVPLAIAGVALGVLAEQTDGWVAPAVAHFALNGFGVLVWARLYPADPPDPSMAFTILVAGGLVATAALLARPRRGGY